MNYLQLIQEVSKVRYKSIPSTFSDVTGSPKKFYDIRKEIDNAVKDFFLDNFHNFREAKAVLNTVDGQRAYSHDYGVIKNIALINSDGHHQSVKERADYSAMEATYSNSSEGIPMYFIIYSGQIHLYPTPDAVYTLRVYYNSDKFAKQKTTIDDESEAEQKTLNITSTQGLASGDTVLVEPKTPREEIGIIDTIASGLSIDLVSNLEFTHDSGYVEKHKDSFEYGEDEPNFPLKFHDIIETKALMEIYLSLGDANEYQKYKKQYDKKYDDYTREMRGSQGSGLSFNYGGRR